MVPQLILLCKNLRILQIGYNQINNIDILFNDALEKLEVLDASNNKINEISDNIAYTLPRI